MTFLEAVNRVLRMEGIIMGDDDDQTSFSQTQHAASMSLAKIAIQSQLADLVAGDVIPYEQTDSTFTTTNGTRTYALAAGFLTLQELFMETVESSAATGTRIYHYPGGETQLRADNPKYREDAGTPIYFYFIGGNSKTAGLVPVPDSALTYRYYYQADVNVSVSSDTIPMATETEAQTFVRMCARHFKYMKASPEARENLFPFGVERDPVILGCRATLMNLMNPLPERAYYGKRYART